jgi:hypothetical protein
LAPSPYFANEDKYKIRGRPPVLVGAESKLDELRFGVFHRSGIDGEITSLNKSLLLFISQSLELFFIWESFGTRQSKGFGSFTIDLIGEKRVVPSKQALSKLFVRSKSVKPDVVQIMSQIKEEFALLKSGINFKGYKKSELFMYFVKQGVRWEKRHIKQAIDSGHNGEKAKRELYSKKNIPPINWNDGSDKFENYWTDPEGANYNYQFIRALLGLTDKYEFQVFKKRRDGQNWQVEYDDRDAPKVDYGSGFNVNIKHLPAEKEPTIDRFKSPIRYKVIENKIYVGADHSYRSILGKVFQFTYDFNDRNGEPKVTRLTTPTKFNIIDFLNKHLSKDWKSI